jgi:hypothetical protein
MRLAMTLEWAFILELSGEDTCQGKNLCEPLIPGVFEAGRNLFLLVQRFFCH